ncbi:MAG: iron-sulfur cluster assembly accessory protein [Gammaproteobacteria bacterium]|nr:iron-sulfur cluster assembly accessory protein [Gammaproteobacteria bacterium]NIR83273.1 iron-sulfur cluster assembly accessory protein [Gammaproteobacteria bacterium]NIR91073.1 iron-sulfur cluster assembly accessory protein [Gammaproteobacteria bacterium]NIU04440.1 iron-sulfur cluster assembly accessory protein [Gammaproteobacteria bacterium]NIW87076.1 iron-sulfur cluster assembly accessory protein [Gammaproteobacteria bacterium]
MSTEATPAYRDTIGQEEVQITPLAREQLAKLFAEVDDDDIEAIRIFVGGGGCSGMSYGMTFTDRRTPYDKVLQAQGFDIYVDAVALNYLRGVEIDYVSRPTGASFVFNNVFAAVGGSGTCSACGAAVGAGGGCA